MENQTITLQGKEYQAKLDFTSLAKVQAALRKYYDLKLKFPEIFQEFANQNVAVITEIAIQSILRVHSQFKREAIEDLLTLDIMEEVVTFVSDLITAAMPDNDNKKK